MKKILRTLKHSHTCKGTRHIINTMSFAVSAMALASKVLALYPGTKGYADGYSCQGEKMCEYTSNQNLYPEVRFHFLFVLNGCLKLKKDNFCLYHQWTIEDCKVEEGFKVHPVQNLGLHAWRFCVTQSFFKHGLHFINHMCFNSSALWRKRKDFPSVLWWGQRRKWKQFSFKWNPERSFLSLSVSL